MRNTASATDKAKLTIRTAKYGHARPTSLARATKNFAPTTTGVAPGDEIKSRAGIQETAFQPSGNGISGQADLLSLAAFGS
jgi:hypothetical protein